MIFGTGEVLLDMIMIDPLSKRSYVQLASPIDLQVLFARWDYEPEKIEVHDPRSGCWWNKLGQGLGSCLGSLNNAGSPHKNNQHL